MLIRPALCILVVGAVSGSLSGAQISVGRNVWVSRSHHLDAHYEVCAAVDPKNPSRLIAASFLYPHKGDEAQTVVYTSRDHGKSWKPTLQGSSMQNTGDPSCFFDADGTAYYVSSLIPPAGQRSMLLFRSSNGGYKWDPPDTLTYTDREYVTVDNTEGRYRGRVYVSGNNRIPPGISDIVVFYSTDQGRSFHGPGKRAGFGQFEATQMGNDVVDADGTLIAVFVQKNENDQSGRPHESLYSTTSVDGGKSFTDAVEIADYMPGGNRKGDHNNVNSLPSLAIDSSRGKYKGRLYVVWPDRRTGHSEIYSSYSADKGRTWSKPRIINDNPDSDTTDQSMPEVAVNKNGTVGVIWSDRRDHKDNLGWDIRFAASSNGSETFHPSVKVSEGGTTFNDRTDLGPLRPAVARAVPVKVGNISSLELRLNLNNFIFIGGDTAALVADGDGIFHAFWTDNHSGVSQIWTAPIKVAPLLSGSSRIVQASSAHDDRSRVPILISPAAQSLGSSSTETRQPELHSIAHDRYFDPVSAEPNLSSKISVEITHASFDHVTGLLSGSLELLNVSGEPVRGPFTVCVSSLDSQLADISIERAANGLSKAGATWNFRGTELAPGMHSKPVHIVFRLRNFRQFFEADRYRLGLLRLDVAVLRRSGTDRHSVDPAAENH